MTTNEKIAALRAAVKQAGGDGVLLMCSDPHSGEYLPAHYNAITYFSGFHGENCTLIVTIEGSALWCDGRFYVQADKELAGTEIVSMHDGAAGVPTVKKYLADHFDEGKTLLLDGSCIPTDKAKEFEKLLNGQGAFLRSADVISPLWEGWGERPALPNTPCNLLTPAQTGCTAAQRIAMVREVLQKAKATACPVTLLDCVGWLLNLRARDLPNTPLAAAFAFVTMDCCALFLAPGRLKPEDEQQLKESGVTLYDYDAMTDYVAAYPKEETVLYAPATTNFALYTAMRNNPKLTVKEGTDPILPLKGVKNETELKNIRECHIQDGVAVCRFQMDLEKAIAEGKPLREFDIDGMLKRRRAEQPDYFDDSFATIAAYGANGAMMHYQAKAGADSAIGDHGFLLVDNGGQYTCGTTDITRTYAVGPLTDNERKYYTWVLQSHIDMARAVFLDYATGFALDTFARASLWAHRINYRCGTGHGVGFISAVHEGPQSLRPQNGVTFKPGMTITDEPGVYETDEVGIRIENELECVALETNEYGNWLGFRVLTMVPIDTDAVLVDELSREQIDWLNNYHKTVYAALSPRMTEEEKVWLANKCKPIER